MCSVLWKYVICDHIDLLPPPKNVLALPSASQLKKAGAATGQTARNTFHRSEYIASNLQFLVIVFVAAILV